MTKRNILLFFVVLFICRSISLADPILSLQYQSIDFPAWGKPGLPHDSTIVCENTGDALLTYTITKFETSPTNNWLSVAGVADSISSGVSNLDTITIHLNTGGILNPTIKQVATGGVVFTGNFTTSPDTLPIRFTVADTVTPPTFDTIYIRQAGTPKQALVVSSNGNFGNHGQGKVNMDYTNYGDCDTTAAIYLYDGSAVIGWVQGSDTIMNWAIGNYWLNDSTSLRPYAGLPDTTKWHHRFRDCPNFEYYRSDRFVTFDTSLALEKFWFAPKTSTSGDSLFIIQGLKVWNISGAPLSGVTVGDVIDWNVPSDSGAVNASGVNTSPAYIWQRGIDYADTLLEGCQGDSLRWAGMKFIGRYTKTISMIFNDSNAYSAYTTRNDSFVDSNGNFNAGELYRNFAIPGTSTEASAADLHMGMCFRHNFSINPSDTFVFYTVSATVRSGSKMDLQNRLVKGKAWFNARGLANLPLDTCAIACCCVNRGDVRHNGGITINDLTFLVAFLFNGGAAPPCSSEANINATGSITVSDVIYLVQYLFNGGPHPPECTCP